MIDGFEGLPEMFLLGSVGTHEAKTFKIQNILKVW